MIDQLRAEKWLRRIFVDFLPVLFVVRRGALRLTLAKP